MKERVKSDLFTILEGIQITVVLVSISNATFLTLSVKWCRNPLFNLMRSLPAHNESINNCQTPCTYLLPFFGELQIAFCCNRTSARTKPCSWHARANVCIFLYNASFTGFPRNTSPMSDPQLWSLLTKSSLQAFLAFGCATSVHSRVNTLRRFTSVSVTLQKQDGEESGAV